MEAVYFEGDKGVNVVRKEIPEDQKSRAEEYREKMVEAIAETDETLMEKYLEGETISTSELKKALRKATISNEIVPVFGGSAYKNIGVQLLLDGIIDYCAAPTDIESIKGEKKNKLKENIKSLEDLSNSFNNIFKEIKEIFEKVEKNKEDLKLKVQKAFTKIRTALNEREDKLLAEIDDLYSKRYFNEDIINKGEKLPKKIKVALDK